MFLLDHFWPFLKFGWIVGLFPCEKVSNAEETQRIRLKPTNGFAYIFRFIIFHGITLPGTQILIIGIIQLYDPDFSYIGGSLTFLRKMNPSNIDYITYMIYITTMQLIQWCCIFNNWSMRHGLNQLQEQISNHGYLVSKYRKKCKMIKLNFVIFFLLFLSAPAWTSIGLSHFLMDTFPVISDWKIGNV